MAFVLSGSVELVTWKQGLMVVKLFYTFRDNFHKISAILLEIDPQHRQTHSAKCLSVLMSKYISCRSESSKY